MSRREMSVKARVVVLAAGTLESTRLLAEFEDCQLERRDGPLPHRPDLWAGIACSVPEARDGKATEALMGGGALIPRFRNIDTKSEGFYSRLCAQSVQQHGRHGPRSTFPSMATELEKKLDELSRQRLFDEDHGRGAGALRESCEHRQGQWWMRGTFRRCTSRRSTPTTSSTWRATRWTRALRWPRRRGSKCCRRITIPIRRATAFTRLGTCRMGDDPKTSVLNKWNQSHDIKNLFVVDGAAFVSAGWQNPTMTILSLSMRSSEYLAEQMRKGNV